MTNNIHSIIEERQTTHGDFEHNAFIIQSLKAIVREGVNHSAMNNIQVEALDMILHKIGRIVNGNPNHKDHWDDISGYAELVSTRVEKKTIATIATEIIGAIHNEQV